MNWHKQHAATWLAFSAGMFAEAQTAAGKHIDETIDEDAVKDYFFETCGDALAMLELDDAAALASFDAGRKTMADLRQQGLAHCGLPIPEDCPPMLYTGAERQLTGKPDRGLS